MHGRRARSPGTEKKVPHHSAASSLRSTDFQDIAVGESSLLLQFDNHGFGILYGLMIREMQRPASTGIEAMMAKRATVIMRSGNGIKVFVKGETWDAECKDDVSEGETVEITGFEHMRLTVKKRTVAGRKT